MPADPVNQLSAVASVPHMLDGATDRRGITTDLATHLVEFPTLLAGRLRAGATSTVPDIGVPRHHPHHLVAARPDPDRRMRFLDWLRTGDSVLEMVIAAIERCPFVGPERDHRLERFTKPPDPMVEPLDPVHLVFGLRPAGAAKAAFVRAPSLLWEGIPCSESGRSYLYSSLSLFFCPRAAALTPRGAAPSSVARFISRPRPGPDTRSSTSPTARASGSSTAWTSTSRTSRTRTTALSPWQRDGSKAWHRRLTPSPASNRTVWPL